MTNAVLGTIISATVTLTHCEVTEIIVPKTALVVGSRWSFFLWQPMFIGSRCQLALCHWSPSVLQTNDQCWLRHYHFNYR